MNFQKCWHRYLCYR